MTDNSSISQNCTQTQAGTSEHLLRENEMSLGDEEHQAAEKTILNQSEFMETTRVDSHNANRIVFIGNLRPDIGKDLAVKTLKELFLRVGVCISDEEFSMPLKGPRKSKYIFVTLKSEHEAACVINQFNGFQDSEIVAEGRALKVCLKEYRPTRKRRKRKLKSLQTTSDRNENNEESTGYECTDVDNATDEETKTEDAPGNPKKAKEFEINNIHSRDEGLENKTVDSCDRTLNGLEREHRLIENENSFEMKTSYTTSDDFRIPCKYGSSELACFSGAEINLMTAASGGKKPKVDMQGAKLQVLARFGSLPNYCMADVVQMKPSRKKVLMIGQVLPNEDRKIEYKMGNRKYMRRNLIGHVRKYSCAFLNSEGM